MYVKIGNTSYTTIKNLSFAPEVDITCQQVSSNEFSVEIVTIDSISVGAKAKLYDDSNNLWADYWVYDCYRVSANIWRVIARDLLWQLDNIIMPSETYGVNDNDLEDAGDIIDEIFDYGGISSGYSVASSLLSIQVAGYAKEQTARERLQEVCFVIGAYINTCFCNGLQILQLPTSVSGTEIPENEVFMSPLPNVEEPISALNISWYQYRKTTEDEAKESDYETVTVGDNIYAQFETVVKVENSSAIRKNEINISGITIVDGGNVWNIVNRLALVYFSRRTVSFECINNVSYKPGEVYEVPTGIGSETIIGYITSADFSFGQNARSRIQLKQATEYSSLNYTAIFNYVYDVEGAHTLLGSWTTVARLSAIVTSKNPIYDISNEGIRTIYYATEGKTTVKRITQSETFDINYNKALICTDTRVYSSLGNVILEINRVDGAEMYSSDAPTLSGNVLILKQ